MSFKEILILTRITIGAICSFFSIMVWSKTRDPAWILMVLGTLFMYAEIVYSTLFAFGIIGSNFFVIAGFPVLKYTLLSLPLLCYSIGFIIIVTRKEL